MKNDYILAVQQLIGYRHGRDGYDFVSLLESMGMTEAEWKRIKRDEAGLLTEANIADGDELFATK